MTLNLTVTPQLHTDFTPRITVVGVGGGGTNAVDNMIAMNLQGVEFIVANTDAQQLVHSRADRRIQLGPHITQGLGAGAKPEIGRMAAEEAADEISRHLDGAHMVFITAGMGGGTGTGAAPVIARMARERGILTVGVVTKPFTFEGSRRAKAAEAGIADLTQYVDTLIVIPNQNLFRLANDRTGWKEAFKMADNVLYMGVRGVTDLMVAPGMVNLDFADIRTVMGEMGKAMMGTGEAEGENRAIRAAEAAISNPLLEDTCMAGARGLLINITGGEDMTLFEVDQAANRIREEVDEDANIIFGSAVDDNLAGKIRVSVVATGIDTPVTRTEAPRLVAVGGGAMAVSDVETPAQASLPQLQPQSQPQPQPQTQAAAPAGAVGQMRPSVTPMPGAGRTMPPPVPPAQMRGFAQPQAQPAGLRTAPQPQPVMAPPPAAEPIVAQPALLMRDVEVISDDEPAPRRQIPEHLQKPLKPETAKPARPAGSGLFNLAPEKKAEVAPPTGQRRSLFNIVTGAIRGGLPLAGGHHAEAVPQQTPHAPVVAEESLTTTTRTASRSGAEEAGIEIPTFLRRQSS